MEISHVKGGTVPSVKKSAIKLVHMKSYFKDRSAVSKRLYKNPTIYEVYEVAHEGLSYARTTLHAGRIGKEFFMTRGHVHTSGDPEIYYVISGKGILLIENETCNHMPLRRGCIAYVPKDKRHRMVNVGRYPFIFVAFYSTGIGHDYRDVEAHGFTKQVVAKRGGWALEGRMGKKV
jgi:glucose-6-phosphate isomerase